MKNCKTITFIGFAIKARKVRSGVNAIKTLKGGVEVLILCSTASENTLNDAVKLSKKFNCPLVISKAHKIEDIVQKEHCKLIAIQDKSLSKAILENLDDSFELYSGGIT